MTSLYLDIATRVEILNQRLDVIHELLEVLAKSRTAQRGADRVAQSCLSGAPDVMLADDAAAINDEQLGDGADAVLPMHIAPAVHQHGQLVAVLPEGTRRPVPFSSSSSAEELHLTGKFFVPGWKLDPMLRLVHQQELDPGSTASPLARHKRCCCPMESLIAGSFNRLLASSPGWPVRIMFNSFVQRFPSATATNLEPKSNIAEDGHGQWIRSLRQQTHAFPDMMDISCRMKNVFFIYKDAS